MELAPSGIFQQALSPFMGQTSTLNPSLNMDSTTPHTRRVPSHNDRVLRAATTDLRKMAVANPNIGHLSHEAKDATQVEKSMTFMQAIRLYPKAVAWSVLLSTSIVMEGYDTMLLASFYVFPQFVQKYGSLDRTTNPPTYQLTAAWQTGLQNGAQVGEILGLYGAGIVVDRQVEK